MNLIQFITRLLLGKREPIKDGNLTAEGIKGRITVKRDEWGVPHITAEGEEDAWYGLGFCEGQDRTFQLEMLRRLARGTFSEVVGEEVLELDRLARRMGFRHYANQHVDQLNDRERRCLQSFVDGINEGITRGRNRCPHEMVFLWAKPKQFEPEDILAIFMTVALGLNANWDSELARLKILVEDGPEALENLDPTYAHWHSVTVPPGEQSGLPIDKLGEDLNQFSRMVGTLGASNNWVIGSEKTATSRPILANDPHLPPKHPPHWYLAHIRTGDWSVAGAALVGVPSFGLGHNESVAWGATSGHVDMTDLFVEELDKESEHVRDGDEMVECQIREETIQIKGSEPVTERVLTTPRGPVITPILDDTEHALSLKTTTMWPQGLNVQLDLPTVETVDEFRNTFEDWTSLTLHMVAADDSGNIGSQLVGRPPKRPHGSGTIPRPGYREDVNWEGPVDYDCMPECTNPAHNYLATANNKPAGDDTDEILGVDWLEGYRVTRISDGLDARDDWTINSSMKLQEDVYSLPWEEIKDIVLNTLEDVPHLREIRFILQEWDGFVRESSPGATIFELFSSRMIQKIAQSKAPNSAPWALGKGATELTPNTMFALRRVSQLVSLLNEQPEGWFEESWDQVLLATLEEVHEDLRERFGNSPTDWVWGSVRALTIEHPLGEKPPLDRIFNIGPIQWSGDTNTVNQASVDPRDPTSNPIAIASLRATIDVGEWDRSRFSMPGGQSGNPFSEHYDDLLEYWQDGEGVPIHLEPEQIDEVAESELVLEPSE